MKNLVFKEIWILSKAEKAGIKVGDVILKANDRVIRSSRDIHNLVGLMRIGQTVRLEISRKGKRGVIIATIQQMEVVTVDGGELSHRLRGARVGEIKEIDIQTGQVEYLQVIDVESMSPAWNAGLRKGDIIRSINRQRVRSFDDAYVAAQSSRALLLNIERGDQAMYVLLK